MGILLDENIQYDLSKQRSSLASQDSSSTLNHSSSPKDSETTLGGADGTRNGSQSILSPAREHELFEFLKGIEWDLFNAYRVEIRGISEFWSETYRGVVSSSSLVVYRQTLFILRAGIYTELLASLWQ